MTFSISSMGILLFGASLFGLVCVLRFSFYLGLLDRVIFVASIWGLSTSDWSLAIPLGIFFELLWLDLIGAGTYIPPNANFPLLLCLSIGLMLPGSLEGSVPLLLIALTLPLAYLATALEQWHRRKQVYLHDRLVEEKKMEDRITSAVIGRSLLELWCLQAGLFLMVGFILFCTCNVLIQIHGALPGPKNLTWPALWAVAVLGAVLSLRTKRALLAPVVVLSVLGILTLPG